MTFDILMPEEEAIVRECDGIPAYQLLVRIFDACNYDDSVLHQLDFEKPSARPDSVCCITRANGYAICEYRFVDCKGPVATTKEYEDAYHFLCALHIILPNYIVHPFRHRKETR